MLLPKYGWLNTKLSIVGFRLEHLKTKIYWYGLYGYIIDGFVVKYLQVINIPHDFTSCKLSEFTDPVKNTIRFPLIYYEGLCMNVAVRCQAIAQYCIFRVCRHKNLTFLVIGAT